MEVHSLRTYLVKMDHFPATYYRSLLSPTQRDAYREITGALLKHHTDISLDCCGNAQDICEVVCAVHMDHPELYYIDFRHYYPRYHTQYGIRTYVGVRFQMILEPSFVRWCDNTIEREISNLEAKSKDLSAARKYRLVMHHITSQIKYKKKDNSNDFAYHTAMGPILNHTAVCEGVAKLFLLYCQRLSLPCIMLFGSVDGQPHAWNVIKTPQGFRHIDVTACLGYNGFLINSLPMLVLKSSDQMKHLGYRWDEKIFPY